MPYAIIHDGLLMPLFGCIVLGLAGENPLAHALGVRPLVFVGEASYCLYLLHFNLWNLIHDSHVLDALGLSRFDPWLSYVLLIALALLALHFIEKPAQRKLREWMEREQSGNEPVSHVTKISAAVGWSRDGLTGVSWSIVRETFDSSKKPSLSGWAFCLHC